MWEPLRGRCSLSTGNVYSDTPYPVSHLVGECTSAHDFTQECARNCCCAAAQEGGIVTRGVRAPVLGSPKRRPSSHLEMSALPRTPSRTTISRRAILDKWPAGNSSHAYKADCFAIPSPRGLSCLSPRSNTTFPNCKCVGVGPRVSEWGPFFGSGTVRPRAAANCRQCSGTLGASFVALKRFYGPRGATGGRPWRTVGGCGVGRVWSCFCPTADAPAL